MAAVVRFRSKHQLFQDDQADQVRSAIAGIEGLPPDAVNRVCAAIDQNTAAKNGWSFIMLSPKQNAAVVRWLSANSQRPQMAVQLWALCFTYMRNDTGQICRTRVELAEELGVHEKHVSEVMTELEGINAISRRRERVDGLRGPGFVRYFMNPLVATSLPNKEREKAQHEALPLFARLDDYRRSPTT